MLFFIVFALRFFSLFFHPFFFSSFPHTKEMTERRWGGSGSGSSGSSISSNSKPLETFLGELLDHLQEHGEHYASGREVLRLEVSALRMLNAVVSPSGLPQPAMPRALALRAPELCAGLARVLALSVHPAKECRVVRTETVELGLFRGLHRLKLDRIKPACVRGWRELSRRLTVLTVVDSVAALEEVLDVRWADDEPPTGSSSSTESLEDLVRDGVWGRLKVLNVEGNAVPAADASLALLRRVERVNLAHNLLRSVRGFQHCYCLSFLTLEGNMIDSLRDVGLELGCVRSLVLRGNRLMTTDGIETLAGLEELDLGCNLIADDVEVARLGRLPVLAKVWLDGNPVARTRRFRALAVRCFARQIVSQPFAINGDDVDAKERLAAQKYLLTLLDDPAAAPALAASAPAAAVIATESAADSTAADGLLPGLPGERDAEPREGSVVVVRRPEGGSSSNGAAVRREDSGGALLSVSPTVTNVRVQHHKKRKSRVVIMDAVNDGAEDIMARSPTRGLSAAARRARETDQMTAQWKSRIDSIRSDAGDKWLLVVDEMAAQSKPKPDPVDPQTPPPAAPAAPEPAPEPAAADTACGSSTGSGTELAQSLPRQEPEPVVVSDSLAFGSPAAAAPVPAAAPPEVEEEEKEEEREEEENDVNSSSSSVDYKEENNDEDDNGTPQVLDVPTEPMEKKEEEEEEAPTAPAQETQERFGWLDDLSRSMEDPLNWELRDSVTAQTWMGTQLFTCGVDEFFLQIMRASCFPFGSSKMAEQPCALLVSTFQLYVLTARAEIASTYALTHATLVCAVPLVHLRAAVVAPSYHAFRLETARSRTARRPYPDLVFVTRCHVRTHWFLDALAQQVHRVPHDGTIAAPDSEGGGTLRLVHRIGECTANFTRDVLRTKKNPAPAPAVIMLYSLVHSAHARGSKGKGKAKGRGSDACPPDRPGTLVLTPTNMYCCTERLSHWPSGTSSGATSSSSSSSDSSSSSEGGGGSASRTAQFVLQWQVDISDITAVWLHPDARRLSVVVEETARGARVPCTFADGVVADYSVRFGDRLDRAQALTTLERLYFTAMKVPLPEHDVPAHTTTTTTAP